MGHRPTDRPVRGQRQRSALRRRRAAGRSVSAAGSAAAAAVVPASAGRGAPAGRRVGRVIGAALGLDRQLVRQGDLAGRPRQALVQRELAVLEHQGPEVARVEQLDVEVRDRARAAGAACGSSCGRASGGGSSSRDRARGPAGRSRARSSRRRHPRGSTGSGTCAARTPSGRRRSRGSATSRLRSRARTAHSPIHDRSPPVVPVERIEPADEVAVPAGQVVPDRRDVGLRDRRRRAAHAGPSAGRRPRRRGSPCRRARMAGGGRAPRCHSRGRRARRRRRRRGGRGPGCARSGRSRRRRCTWRRRAADEDDREGPSAASLAERARSRSESRGRYPQGVSLRGTRRLGANDGERRGATRPMSPTERRAPPPADPSHFRHSYSKDKAQLVRRLSRMEGQVRGIARMIEREEYCVDILQQTAALRAAVDARVDPAPRGPRQRLRPDRGRAGPGRPVRRRGHRRRPADARAAGPRGGSLGLRTPGYPRIGGRRQGSWKTLLTHPGRDLYRPASALGQAPG